MARIGVDRETLRRFCEERRIKELSIFGSVLREDFSSESDVDVLVEFEPEARVGMFGLVRMEEDLSALIGRPVDLVTKNALSPHIRDRVLASREIVYVRAG